MATSLDKQLNRLERADAAAASVHCIQVGRDESTEAARVRYESAHPIRDNDVVIFVRGHMEGEPNTAKPKIIAVQRKSASPRLRRPKAPERTWGGTTCPQPALEHVDDKRDPYDWRALDKRKLIYPDYYPSPDAGAADERALRRYAQRLSRRNSL